LPTVERIQNPKLSATVRYAIDQSQAIFSVRYEIDQSQAIFSVRNKIDQLQLILNVNKIILLVVILTDSWHQNIAFWLMFWGSFS